MRAVSGKLPAEHVKDAVDGPNQIEMDDCSPRRALFDELRVRIGKLKICEQQSEQMDLCCETAHSSEREYQCNSKSVTDVPIAH